MTDSGRGLGPGLSSRWVALAPIVLLAIAWMVYRPDVSLPFDFIDFPVNILILKAQPAFLEQFSALSRYYGDHGRFSPITLATIAGQWSLFASWTIGWQLVRFVVMSAVVLMAYTLYIRLGLAVIGAFAAASFLIVSPGAVIGWTRLSTAEPWGMLFLLAGCSIAMRPRTALSSVAFGLMGVGVLWTKEVMLAAFALPVMLALREDDLTSLRLPASLRWFAPAALVVALGTIPVLHKMLSAGPDAFSARYGSAPMAPADVAGAAIASWLPFAPLGEFPWLQAVVLAFVVLVLIGWKQSLGSEAESRRGSYWLLSVALVVPVAGAIVYAPWPFYLLVYALPFTVGGAVALGQAISALARTHFAGVVFATAATGMVLTFSLAQAFAEAGRTFALREAFAATVVRVAAMPDVDSVLVGVPSSTFDRKGNFGPRFREYATMRGLRWPMTRDVVCDDLPSLPHPRTVVLRVNLVCDFADSLSRTVVYRYRRALWPNPLPKWDSVMVTFTTVASPPP